MNLFFYISVLYFLLGLNFAQSLQLKLQQKFEIPYKSHFKETEIGGLSGIWFDENENKLFAVSDDKGKLNEPRIYSFQVTKVTNGKEINFEPSEVIFIKKFSHPSIDMEGLTVLPWGNFFISTEGDNNKKPRIPPQLLDLKKDGTVVREFEIPSAFIPEATGEQKKGILNNRGFEALSKSSSGKVFWVAHESPLLQEAGTRNIHILQYEMLEAWVLTKTQEFIYQLEEVPGAIMNGVTEILGYGEDQLIVLERAISLTKKGSEYSCRLFLFDLKKSNKKLLFDFTKLDHKVENLEGLSWGPLVDGKKSLFVISDNNFKKTEKTLIYIFKIEEGK